jgi:hypothetical protein
MKTELGKDGSTIIVTIPMNLRKRGGRKRIMSPAGMESLPVMQRDHSLAKLVGKAHRWMKELESGKTPTVRILAEREKLDESYVAKVLRLTLLAPDIVKIILDGTQPDSMTWKKLSSPFPVEWADQRKMLGIC